MSRENFSLFCHLTTSGMSSSPVLCAVLIKHLTLLLSQQWMELLLVQSQ